MKLAVMVARSLQADVQAELRDIERAEIIRVFDEGAVIRSGRGHFLAIPTEKRPEDGNRWQADQPAHLSGASVRVAAVRASTNRTVAPGGGIARLAD